MCIEKDEGQWMEVDTERHDKRRGKGIKTREKERGRKKGRKDWKGRNEGWGGYFRFPFGTNIW